MKGYDSYSQEDSLVDRGLEDNLDEGYSPMERQPASHRRTTGEEQREGDTWEDRLEQEVPEQDPYVEAADEDAARALPDGPWSPGMDPDPRAGRLLAPDEGAHEDTEKDEVAQDVGIAGGAATAEEAAMHVVEPEQ